MSCEEFQFVANPLSLRIDRRTALYDLLMGIHLRNGEVHVNLYSAS
jgi:hypothetical protein